MSENPPSQPPGGPLHNIPPELRIKIYKDIFAAFDASDFLGFFWAWATPSHGQWRPMWASDDEPKPDTALLITSRQCHSEASAVLYRRLEFTLVITPFQGHSHEVLPRTKNGSQSSLPGAGFQGRKLLTDWAVGAQIQILKITVHLGRTRDKRDVVRRVGDVAVAVRGWKRIRRLEITLMPSRNERLPAHYPEVMRLFAETKLLVDKVLVVIQDGEDGESWQDELCVQLESQLTAEKERTLG